MNYILIDLERTIQTGKLHYWKANAHGYTTNANEAGLYEPYTAQDYVGNDINNMTVAVSQLRFENLANITMETFPYLSHI